jgi:hypothetical protein
LRKIPFFTLLAAMILSGCNSSEEQIVNEDDVTNPSREEQRADTQAPPEEDIQITETAGLGDTREVFNETYGEPEGDKEIANYMDDFMVVTFENHRAVNIELHFGSNQEGPHTEEEILAYIQERIPTDAEEIERSTNDQNSQQEIIQYKSETLKNTVSDESFIQDEPGAFIVILEKGMDTAPFATITLGKGQNI